MAYRFKRGGSVAKEVPRVAEKQVERALDALAGDDQSEAVHDARTAIKRLRGLLRLIAPDPGGRAQKDTRKMRDLADQLSDLRDAEVMVQTFDRLWQLFEPELGPAVRRVRARLLQRLRSVVDALDRPERMHESQQGFRKLRKRVQKWVPRHGHKQGGWAALAPGLTETYAKGRRWFRRAGESHDEHAFHQWRRHVKYHGYHLQLLADVWPDEVEDRGNALTHLGEVLGEDHDLAVFRATLEAEPSCFENAKDRRRLFACIAARQKSLRSEALPLGERLYAQAPGAFTERMKEHWDAWRHEQRGRGKPAAKTKSAAKARAATKAKPATKAAKVAAKVAAKTASTKASKKASAKRALTPAPKKVSRGLSSPHPVSLRSPDLSPRGGER
jgi:CHAD domain-containing protein